MAQQETLPLKEQETAKALLAPASENTGSNKTLQTGKFLLAQVNILRAITTMDPDKTAQYLHNAWMWDLKARAACTQNLAKNFTDLAAIQDTQGNTAESLAAASGNEDMLRIIKAARVIRAIQMAPHPSYIS
ncbi:MAG TPA: hypothetical protein DCW68_04700 [Rhodospirillaceae bacterium]|nr:MAG: hypothetical protein A2018_02945 [Alphaproteobacteria bacterium GWF2_58_20]HAU29395.1 hypothetical protein [Rhodospirillaceae bacterium]